MLIDTHSHIYTEDFAPDRDEVIARAVQNGIEKMVMPNVDSASIPDLMETTRRHPGVCYPLMGLHPTSVDSDYKKELDIVGNWLCRYSFSGMGEIGIDLYWDRTFRIQQEDAFRQQLRMARESNHPVVIHVRESFPEVCAILEEEQDGSLSGIFHCFSGSVEDAHRVTSLGFFLGIGGVVTYKNSSLPSVLKETDLKNLVLETDAPWLSPVPHRGKRNESSFLIHTAEKVAALYGVSLDVIAEVTTGNARRLFHI